MNEAKTPLKHNPFEKLKKRLKAQSGASPVPEKKSETRTAHEASESDEKVFRQAMEGVKPIARDAHQRKQPHPPKPTTTEICVPGQSVTDCLKNLVESGEGFIVSNTPEYMEGTGPDVAPEFAERLHRGDFSIQAHIDLHGMGVAEAKDAFESFVRSSIMSGKRAVLIVHGRGLSSPGEPVLKNKVREWLTRSHWRKWVIAFASAQSYDGGAGATYVLLRHRPATKKSRKKI